ncbi:MAG: aldo/keto reductase [Anaerolineae bacterium]|nr:aldo/keto reductase [Anaerolineae bacterium]
MMEYVTLGRTGRTVSRLGFGGAPAGLTNYLGAYTPADAQQRRQVIEALQCAYECGVTYFDTAPGYGNGESEVIFGEALSGLGDSIFVATKIGPEARNVRESVETSLKRLQRDHLDVLQIHGSSYSERRADDFFQSGGMLEQMQRLKEEGLIRAVGFTTEDNNPAVYRFINSGHFDVMQLCYNLLYQHPAEFTRPFGSIFEADKQQMGIVTMRTVTSGLFQRWVQWANPENTFDYTPALLQFVLSNPMVDVALVGMRDAGIVRANAAICEDLTGRIDLEALHKKYV